MNYAEAVAHLYALGQELAAAGNASLPRRKFDLTHMRALIAALGNPQDAVASVLIAGTNGKGSTAATLASILTAAGYRTGLYTSPHLERVNERMQMARATFPSEYGNVHVPGSEGELVLSVIPDEDFAGIYSRVWSVAETLVRDRVLPHTPSFFEMLTAVAFCWFASKEADLCVLEVGLGGRLDATNVVEPLVSVITDIALDHQDYLGETLTEIAGEKCGILRKRGTLVTLSQHPEVNQAIGVAATALDVHAVNAAMYLPAATRNGNMEPGSARNRYEVRPEGSVRAISVDSPLAGHHQRRNIALAIAAAVELRTRFGIAISDEDLERGIARTVWPGRLEYVTEGLLLDVAHNPAGAWALRAELARLPDEMPRTLVFSCLKDKNLREMSRILFPLFDASSPDRARDHIVLVQMANGRAAALSDLVAAARDLEVEARAAVSVEAALELAREVTPRGGVVVGTGSVYLVGELRELALRTAEVCAG